MSCHHLWNDPYGSHFGNFIQTKKPWGMFFNFVRMWIILIFIGHHCNKFLRKVPEGVSLSDNCMAPTLVRNPWDQKFGIFSPWLGFDFLGQIHPDTTNFRQESILTLLALSLAGGCHLKDSQEQRMSYCMETSDHNPLRPHILASFGGWKIYRKNVDHWCWVPEWSPKNTVLGMSYDMRIATNPTVEIQSARERISQSRPRIVWSFFTGNNIIVNVGRQKNHQFISISGGICACFFLRKAAKPWSFTSTNPSLWKPTPPEPGILRIQALWSGGRR